MAANSKTAANLADFRLHVADREGDDLRVAAFAGSEGLSEMFEFRIELVSPHDSLNSEDYLGRDATLEIDGDGGTRTLHGIVRRFERTGRGTDMTHYEARLVPPHWLLTKRIASRVFSKKRIGSADAVSIVRKVLTDAGVPAKAVRIVTLPKYEERELTVQYRESDWNFISRLLEDEGVYYYFEHGSDGCVLVIADAKEVHPPFATDFSVPFREPRDLAEREFVHTARRLGRIEIGATALDDFDFKRPPRELRVDRKAGRFTSLAYVDYPGGFVDEQRGERLTQTRLEEEQCRVNVFRFAATVRGFWGGVRFRLNDHPDERFNQEYLITRVTHRATQRQSAEADNAGGEGTRYKATVRAIPVDVQFRPPRATFRPTVLGSQTAIVVGPPSEEIHTDAYGRVEVRFHWDQEGPHDVGASCWVRVNQGWAGGQYGMMFLPRVGQEVIVDFLEGNPDWPIITGRVYNGDHMPPYKLPENKSISTIRTCTTPGAKGGNEIRFDDSKGGEQLLLFAQNSLHLRARGSRYESVCGDAHDTVAGNVYEEVKKSKHELITLDRREEVKGTKFDYVGGDVLSWVWGKCEATIHGQYKISNRGGGIDITSAKSIELMGGGNFIRIDESGITIVGKVVNINSGGASVYPGDFSSVLTPEKPHPADTTESGHNVRYTREADAGPGTDEGEDKPTSWIEIELIDEAGQPVPHEPYEIKLPDGKSIRGSLNERGQAHVAVRDPGLCEITFPRLDAAAWERLG